MEISGHRTRDVFERYNIVSENDLRDAARKLGQRFLSETVTSLGTNGMEGSARARKSLNLLDCRGGETADAEDSKS